QVEAPDTVDTNAVHTDDTALAGENAAPEPLIEPPESSAGFNDDEDDPWAALTDAIPREEEDDPNSTTAPQPVREFESPLNALSDRGSDASESSPEPAYEATTPDWSQSTPEPQEEPPESALLQLTEDDPFDVALGQALNDELFSSVGNASFEVTSGEQQQLPPVRLRRPSSAVDDDDDLIDIDAPSLDPSAFDDLDDGSELLGPQIPDSQGPRPNPALSSAAMTPLWPEEADSEDLASDPQGFGSEASALKEQPAAYPSAEEPIAKAAMPHLIAPKTGAMGSAPLSPDQDQPFVAEPPPLLKERSSEAALVAAPDQPNQRKPDHSTQNTEARPAPEPASASTIEPTADVVPESVPLSSPLEGPSPSAPIEDDATIADFGGSGQNLLDSLQELQSASESAESPFRPSAQQSPIAKSTDDDEIDDDEAMPKTEPMPPLLPLEPDEEVSPTEPPLDTEPATPPKEKLSNVNVTVTGLNTDNSSESSNPPLVRGVPSIPAPAFRPAKEHPSWTTPAPQPAIDPNDLGSVFPDVVAPVASASPTESADALPAPKASAASVDVIRGTPVEPKRTIAIDIGGRWAKLGVYEAGEVIVIPVNGQAMLPALAAVDNAGGLVFGPDAHRISVEYPERSISLRAVLRATTEYGLDARIMPRGAEVIDEEIFVSLAGHRFKISEILFQFIALLRASIVRYLESQDFQVMMTVPHDLGNHGRRYLRAACTEAKLELTRVLTEPEALIQAFRLDEDSFATALLVDLGATHLALSVARRNAGRLELTEHRWFAEPSASHFDDMVARMTVDELARQAGEDHRGNSLVIRRLSAAAERARSEVRKSATVDLKVVLPHENQEPFEQTIRLGRPQVYGHVEPLVAEVCRHAQELLRDAELDPRQVGAVVIAGSGGSFPPVVEGLRSLMQQEPRTLSNPAQAYLIGATRIAEQAVQQARAAHPNTLQAAIGIGLPGGRFHALAPTGSPLPLRLRRTYPTTRDNQTDFELHFYQGDGELIKNTTPLGSVALRGFPKGLRAERSITLELHLNTDGVLSVSLSEPHSEAVNTMQVATRQTSAARRQELDVSPISQDFELPVAPKKKRSFLARLFGRE
ncbi:MAG: Hsp70 family protein, partial [Myxococcota bacterium]